MVVRLLCATRRMGVRLLYTSDEFRQRDWDNGKYTQLSGPACDTQFPDGGDLPLSARRFRQS